MSESAGHRIIDAIVNGALVTVDCAASCGAHTFLWSANAPSQIGMMASEEGVRERKRCLAILKDLRGSGRAMLYQQALDHAAARIRGD